MNVYNKKREIIALVEDNMFSHRPLLTEEPRPRPGYVVLKHDYVPLYVKEREIIEYAWEKEDLGPYWGMVRTRLVPVYSTKYIDRFTGYGTRFQEITQEEHKQMTEA